MKSVKMGIIGLGIGQWHLESFLQTKNAEVVALCDANEERLKKSGEQVKIKKLYNNIPDILKDKDVDAVSVCLPNFLHAEVVVSAIKAGKHVLCEKPMTSNVADARKIVKETRKSKKKFMVAMKFRFTPEAHYISNKLKNGDFGEVYYGYTHYMRPLGGIPTGAGNWFINKDKAGGGPLIDNGVHLLDVNWYLIGCPKPVSAFGSTYAKFGPHIESIKKDFDVEDFGCGLIKYENGATIYLDNAWATAVEETVIGLRICGTKGGATMWPFSVIKIKNDKCVAERHDISKEKCETQFEHFVDCILQDRQPVSSAEQGLQMIQMLDAIYKSSETGGVAEIE